MKHKFAFATAIAAAALLSIAATPVSAQESMTKAQAETYLKGNVNGTNSRWTVSFKFEDGGTVWGNATNGSNDSANYKVDDAGQVCLVWKKWEDWCAKLVQQPDGSVNAVNAQGVFMTFKK